MTESFDMAMIVIAAAFFLASLGMLARGDGWMRCPHCGCGHDAGQVIDCDEGVTCPGCQREFRIAVGDGGIEGVKR